MYAANAGIGANYGSNGTTGQYYGYSRSVHNRSATYLRGNATDQRLAMGVGGFWNPIFDYYRQRIAGRFTYEIHHASR